MTTPPTPDTLSATIAERDLALSCLNGYKAASAGYAEDIERKDAALRAILEADASGAIMMLSKDLREHVRSALGNLPILPPKVFYPAMRQPLPLPRPVNAPDDTEGGAPD